jgi:hypothetical protein
MPLRTDTPDDGDFARFIERGEPASARAVDAVPAQTPAHSEDWEARWAPVFRYVSASRFRLLGLIALLTAAVFSAMVALVSTAIYTRAPVVHFLVDSLAPVSVGRVLRSEVHAHYGSSKVEAAEAFQATGQAPPGVGVRMNGHAVEVNDADLLAQKRWLLPVLLLSLAATAAFGWAFVRATQGLLATVPRTVPRRVFWAVFAGLALLEIAVYAFRGPIGLALLLFILGGSTQALWFLLRGARRVWSGSSSWRS